MELIRACGYDLPLELAPYQPIDDRRLRENALLSPERRVEQMLKTLKKTEGKRRG